MRACIIVIVVFFSLLSQAQTPYDLSFPGLGAGQTINMSQYSGKKILVAVINAAVPDERQLRMLDSLYRTDSTTLAIVAVPADDFGEPMEDSALFQYLRDSLRLIYPIAQTGKAGKVVEDEQHPLLRWLTHVDDNNHFDKDIDEAGRVYLLSEAGSLYGLFAPIVTAAELDTALNQTVSQ